MKIKQKRKVNLPELIEWCWENDIRDKFQSVNNEHVSVEIGTGFVDTLFGNIYPYPDSLFEIEEEVEVDEDTVLPVVEIYHYGHKDFNTQMHYHRTIKEILKRNINNLETLFIYLLNEDGSVGELIWKDGAMMG